MSIDESLYVGSALSVFALGLALLVMPAPRAMVTTQIALAIFVPIALLSGYLTVGYRTWNWSIFGYGSLLPWLLAGLLFAIMLWRALFRCTASASAKAIVGTLSSVSWLFLSATAGLAIACRSGDCF